jgi:hypothetical protein
MANFYPTPSLARKLLLLIKKERRAGRLLQPQFHSGQIFASWPGGLLAIAALGTLTNISSYNLIAAPLGASTVLLFGNPISPLAQPRNIIAGNTIAALVSVCCIALLGSTPITMGLAVGLTIALGQWLRCLHPPAGAVALLGVLLKAKISFILFPVLSGSLLLVLMAAIFSRLAPAQPKYPHHWL